jgi:hypothetical protein
MSGYRPDWVGAVTAGAGIWLSIVVATRIWPQRDLRKKVMLLAIGIGAALAIVARTALRYFGI